MQTFSHLTLTPCALFSLSRTIYRLFELHAHLTSLPWLAQVISLVGWPKLLKILSSSSMPQQVVKRFARPESTNTATDAHLT